MAEANLLFNTPAVVEEKKKERPFYKPGWYPDLSNEDYHGSFGFSSSSLKVLTEKTMSHLLYQQSQPNEQTTAMLKGNVLHTLVLEPEMFDKEYAIRPPELKRPTMAQLNAKKPSDKSLVQIESWNAWQKELGDRTEITQEIYDHGSAMAKKVREHPNLETLLDSKIISEESVFYWYNPEDWDNEKDYRIMCKIRPDLIFPGNDIIFDLKSSVSAAETDFARQCKKLGYHISAGMYLDGANRDIGFLRHCGVMAFMKFAWIVVENEPPYEVAIYECDKESLQEGMEIYHRTVRLVHQYKMSKWKGYGVFDGEVFQPEIRVLKLPTYGNKIV